MKTIFCLLAGTVLTSFINKPADTDLDGYWMGYYRSELLKEKVIIKMDGDDRMVFYTGGIDDRTKLEGSYKIYGDSVSFKYTTADGEEVLMQGHFNYRKTYVDGICRTNNKPSGSFYLEKQKLEERLVFNNKFQNKTLQADSK
ncbi:MAG: hypothetical protein J7502_08280 [Flavisolibacter sp.]|nr:hypothetical protein [Flavisolibacter sp.]